MILICLIKNQLFKQDSDQNFYNILERRNLFEKLLIEKWSTAMGKGIFKFKLDKLPSKYLSGKYNFFIQVLNFYSLQSLSQSIKN